MTITVTLISIYFAALILSIIFLLFITRNRPLPPGGSIVVVMTCVLFSFVATGVGAFIMAILY